MEIKFYSSGHTYWGYSKYSRAWDGALINKIPTMQQARQAAVTRGHRLPDNGAGGGGTMEMSATATWRGRR